MTFREGGPLAAAVLLAWLGSACTVGPHTAASPAASGPHGVDVEIVWGEVIGRRGDRIPVSTRRGELLAIPDSGLLVLHAEGVFFYPFGSAGTVQARSAPGTRRFPLDGPEPSAVEALRKYARHPFGLTDDQLDSVLRSLGQDGVVVRGR